MKKFIFYANSANYFFKGVDLLYLRIALTLALIHTINCLVEVIIENFKRKSAHKMIVRFEKD